VIGGPVTARYTEALFGLASLQGAVDVVRGDVETLEGELAEASVALWLFDSQVALEEKRTQLAKLTGSFHPLTRNFVGLLLDKGRIEVLRDLGAAFRLRWLESRGAVEGWVESARPLAPGEMSELAVAIGAKIGKEVLLKNRVEASLVGGVRVFVAGKLIDYSVRGRLAGLRRAMLNTPLPATT
jgi:F-type H+-transporting ATPase subunit delta